MTDEAEFRRSIERLALRLGGGAVSNLHRLSGGASQETWSFGVGEEGFILRRTPAGLRHAQSQAIGLPAEARVIRAACAAGAPAPAIALESEAADPFGPFYVMRRLEGETIARKILRDDAFAQARPRLARQCGAALARIHAVSEALGLEAFDARAQLDRYEEIFRSFETRRPIFDLAFAELRKKTPQPIEPKLVHGDFRLGNLMVDAQGLVAALDWELAHLGDPAEDLGWLCTPSWRFGGVDKPVGGFGALDELLGGYREAGGDPLVDEARVRFWTMMGSLKWGVMCLIMYRAYESGMDASVERAAIGRRASECELDLVLMMQGKL
jgi:aminoglycoside phosphotransferase (APT) family kinase protein